MQLQLRCIFSLCFLLIFTSIAWAEKSSRAVNAPAIPVRYTKDGKILLRFPGPPPVVVGQTIQIQTASGWKNVVVKKLNDTAVLVQGQSGWKMNTGNSIGTRYVVAAATLEPLDGERADSSSKNGKTEEKISSKNLDEYIMLISAGGGLGLMPHESDSGESFQLSLKPSLSLSAGFSLGAAIHQGTFFSQGKKFIVTRIGPEIRIPLVGNTQWELFPYAGWPLYLQAKPQTALAKRLDSSEAAGRSLERRIPYGGIGYLYRFSRRFALRLDAGSDQAALMATMVF